MASGESSAVASSTSPRDMGKSDKASTASSYSPQASGGHCLCSPTKHRGSFRCRYHRTPLRRSNSMPSAASKPSTPVADAKPLHALHN